MKALRFLTIPTLLGWLAAYVICVVAHFIASVAHFGWPVERSIGLIVRDYFSALYVGCILIVVPTYLFVILPLSMIDLRGSKRGRPISAWSYSIALLAAGTVVTAISASVHLTNIGWARSGVEQAILFFLPFLPYSAVVGVAAKRWIPVAHEDRA